MTLRPFIFLSTFVFVLFALSLLPPLFAVETTIKGGRVELLNQGETVLFLDGVQLVRGSDTLHSDQMKTTKKRDKVWAKGRVKLFRRVSEQESWEGFGETGFYNTETGTGYLIGEKGKAHLIRTNVVSSTLTRRVDVYSNRFDFAKEESSAVARGEAYGKTIDPETGDVYEFWADQADYRGREKMIVLGGLTQPRLKQKGSERITNLQGDVITYFVDTKQLMSVGNSEAVFIQPSKGTSP